MEVYEKINSILREKKISKKNFSTKLRNLEPKLKNTGEIPSDKAIYSYLSGHIGLKIELIPYIAEVLDIPEQILFDDSSRVRVKYMNHIASTMGIDEEHKVKSIFCKESDASDMQESKKAYADILELLEYAPPAHLKKIKSSLQEFKAVADKFNY